MTNRLHLIAPVAVAVLAAAVVGPILAQDEQVAASAELAVRDALGQTTGDPDARTGQVEDIDVAALETLLASGNIRLIDVRTDAEVAQGIIPGAEHIPLDQFDPAKLDLSDGREVVLYCRSGRRSAIAGEKLAAVTGKPARHLAGGILAWKAAEQPIAEAR
jgi:rhodanese-related sulfurtransferase